MEIFYCLALSNKLDFHFKHSYRKVAPLKYGYTFF